jgi:hypothetical protein
MLTVCEPKHDGRAIKKSFQSIKWGKLEIFGPVDGKLMVGTGAVDDQHVSVNHQKLKILE